MLLSIKYYNQSNVITQLYTLNRIFKLIWKRLTRLSNKMERTLQHSAIKTNENKIKIMKSITILLYTDGWKTSTVARIVFPVIKYSKSMAKPRRHCPNKSLRSRKICLVQFGQKVHEVQNIALPSVYSIRPSAEHLLPMELTWDYLLIWLLHPFSQDYNLSTHTNILQALILTMSGEI